MAILFKEREKEIKEGKISGVLYGPGIKNVALEVDSRDFEKTYREIGETSLVSLESDKGKYQVLIHDIQRDPMTNKITHVDFYQPNLKEEVEVTVPLVFEGEPPAVKELGGTLIKNILEVEVKALPGQLPHEIKVNVEGLKTFEDAILIKHLEVPQGVQIMKDPEETVALVAPIQDIEEELSKPIDENVEAVEKVETKKDKEKEEESKEE
jgi:large subunit ribosomal protein L25